MFLLESYASGVSDLVNRQVASDTGEPLPAHYSPSLSSFALALNFYSPSALASPPTNTTEIQYWRGKSRIHGFVVQCTRAVDSWIPTLRKCFFINNVWNFN